MKSSLRKIYGHHHDLVDHYGICVTNDHGYVPIVVNTSRSLPHSWLITRFVTRIKRQVPLVEQELLSLPEHMSSSPVFSGVRVTRSLVLWVCFVDRCLSFCTFSFGYYVACSSSIYEFWLPLWYLQTIFNIDEITVYQMWRSCIRRIGCYICLKKRRYAIYVLCRHYWEANQSSQVFSTFGFSIKYIINTFVPKFTY